MLAAKDVEVSENGSGYLLSETSAAGHGYLVALLVVEGVHRALEQHDVPLPVEAKHLLFVEGEQGSDPDLLEVLGQFFKLGVLLREVVVMVVATESGDLL